jgi:hypothetical protein
MRTTVGEIVVRVTLLEEPRESLSKRANVLGNLLGANL